MSSFTPLLGTIVVIFVVKNCINVVTYGRQQISAIDPLSLHRSSFNSGAYKKNVFLSACENL